MAKPKSVNWQMVDGSENIYETVRDLITRYHADTLEQLNFIIMWRYNNKMDKDGYIFINDITKSSDKVRELYEHDVIIGINKDIWEMLEQHERGAVIDTLLERITINCNKNGDPKEDDRSRILYRLRKSEIVCHDTIYRRFNTNITHIQDRIRNKLEENLPEKGSYSEKVLQE